MLTGGVSSAVPIALEKLGQREKVIFMVGNSGSNDTTGKDCQRYGFRSTAFRLHGSESTSTGARQRTRQE